MPKFVLIDHSIRNTGGHYFEYATHVLRSAENAGFTPVAGVHSEFDRSKGSADPRWEIHPVYSFDIWGFGSVTQRKKGFGARILAKARIWYARKKASAHFSRREYFIEVKKQPVEFLRNNAFRIGRVIGWGLLLSPLFYLIELGRKSVELVKTVFRGYPGNVLRSLWELIISVFFPVAFPLRNRRDIGGWLANVRRRRAFAASTRALFRKVRLEKGDLVFIPTLSVIDMMGLHDFLKRDPDSSAATWHLLFRRDIYRGREPDFAAQDEQLQAVRLAFHQLADGLPGHTICFYTDTDKLTDQYNRLNIVPFRTLPIPINPDFSAGSRESAASPLTIVYLGDARGEKGYQFLPSLVMDLWKEYVVPGKIRFEFQSNLPNGKPEHNAPSIIARALLETMPQASVRLLREPLGSSEYRALVDRGDICLLLYDDTNYYARSSGALVECLTVGMPVVVPAGTWLADQFSHQVYRYRNALLSEFSVIAPNRYVRTRWLNIRSRNIFNEDDGGLSFGGRDAVSYHWSRIPSSADVIHLSFRPEEGMLPGSYIRIHVEQQNEKKIKVRSSEEIVTRAGVEERCTVLIPVHPESARMWVGVSNAYHDHAIHVVDLRMQFLRVKRSGSLPPLGAIGESYTSPAFIPDAVRRVVDGYPHYRSTAREFAGGWNGTHTADNLVQKLAAGAVHPAPGRRSGVTHES